MTSINRIINNLITDYHKFKTTQTFTSNNFYCEVKTDRDSAISVHISQRIFKQTVLFIF